MPKVSVLIPTYNAANFLDESITSVLRQTFTDFELIIVDNCSTDNSNEVIAKYLNDKRIRYYTNEKNIGLCGNFNRCLSLAQGEYIKFLCADDKFHSLLLEKFVAIMDRYPNVSLVTSNKEIIGFHTKTDFDIIPYSYLQPGNEIIRASLKTSNWIGEPSSVMIRKSNLEPGKENWRSDLTYLSDWDVWLRHLMLGDCYIIPEKLSYFRIHANQTTSLLKQNYSIRFEQYNFYKSIYDEGRYDVNCFKQELQKVLKVKATDCVSIIYKILPRLGKRTNRTILKKAFAIGISEKVLFNPIFNFFLKKLELSQKKS